MTLRAIVAACGGELYAGGRRANIPAPGHSRADRSVSLLLTQGRVLIHCFGSATWQEVFQALRARGLVDAAGAPTCRTASAVSIVESPSARVRRAAAEALWTAGRTVSAGTPAAAYGRRRGVARPMATIAALRSHCAVPLSVYRPTAMTQPALLAAVFDAAAALTAVEITYLEPSGRRASRLRIPRKTVGVLPPGSAVRLDPAATELLVAEGVFTALSAGERFGLPAWALLSTSNLRRWTPPPKVRSVLIAADRGRDGEASAAVLAASLARLGVRTAIRLPPTGYGDWNDWAQAEVKGRAGRGAQAAWKVPDGRAGDDPDD